MTGQSVLFDNFKPGRDFALRLDARDELAPFREQFHIPLRADGTPSLYLCGNSLGLMPKAVRQAVETEMQAWAEMGVNGYFKQGDPWVRFNEAIRTDLAQIVGAAKPSEVVIMNTLTVNLHLMMVSFYRPQGVRTKILVETNAFPSDRQAINSQIAYHALDPAEHVIEMQPRTGEDMIRTDDILQILVERGEEIALVMIGAVNYYTGQVFDIAAITKAAHDKGCIVGFDLAHAAGNIPLSLHDDGVDFAVWCHYKYLNGGPACPGGAFVHDKHCRDGVHDDTGRVIPRFCGWWGEDLEERFKMTPDFIPAVGAAAWQLSNAPILSLAPVRESLKIFAAAGMTRLRRKSLIQTEYCLYLLSQRGMGGIGGISDIDGFSVLTPQNGQERGAQISLEVHEHGRAVFDTLSAQGVMCDWRAPGVIRIAPVPLYNSYADIYDFVMLFADAMRARHKQGFAKGAGVI